METIRTYIKETHLGDLLVVIASVLGYIAAAIIEQYH